MASLAHHICYRSTQRLKSHLPLELGRIEELRKWLDFASRVLVAPIQTQCQPIQVSQMEAEWLVPKDPDGQVVGLFLHGGGYAIGSLQTHRGLVGRLAQLTGLSFLHIDYRLSPEHPFPAPLEDAVVAYQWLIHQGYEVVLAGDSAGGGLCVSLQLAIRQMKLPQPLACVCFSPWVDLTFSGESAKRWADYDPIVQPEKVYEWGKAYAGAYELTHPMVSPLFGDLGDLPPMLIQASTKEVLTDDARRLNQRILKAGGNVRLQLYPDMLHVWQLMWRIMPEADEALQEAADFLRQQVQQHHSDDDSLSMLPPPHRQSA